MVDGSGVGDIGPAVLREREILADHGFVVAVVPWDKSKGSPRGPVELSSRGFVYLRQSNDLLKTAVELLDKELNRSRSLSKRDAEEIIKNQLERFLYEQTKRRPMIVPVVVE